MNHQYLANCLMAAATYGESCTSLFEDYWTNRLCDATLHVAIQPAASALYVDYERGAFLRIPEFSISSVRTESAFDTVVECLKQLDDTIENIVRIHADPKKLHVTTRLKYLFDVYPRRTSPALYCEPLADELVDDRHVVGRFSVFASSSKEYEFVAMVPEKEVLAHGAVYPRRS